MLYTYDIENKINVWLKEHVNIYTNADQWKGNKSNLQQMLASKMPTKATIIFNNVIHF